MSYSTKRIAKTLKHINVSLHASPTLNETLYCEGMRNRETLSAQ